ncbi:MAG: hypothetical protein ACFNM7_12040, partial [Prevotella conceptionensis]
APYCTAFCTKMHRTLHQIAKKRLKWQAFEINIHFTAFTDQPLSSSKTTFARIVFLGKVNDWSIKRALIMLKIMLKIRQNNFMHTHAVNNTEKACPYYCQHQQLRNNDYNKHVINQ